MNSRMMATAPNQVNGEMSVTDLVQQASRYIRAGCVLLLIMLVVGAFSAGFHGGVVYVASYSLMVLGTLPPILLWCFRYQRNYPIVPAFAFTQLMWNSLPLAVGNPMLDRYLGEEILQGSFEVFLFGIFLTAAYACVSKLVPPKSHTFYGIAISDKFSRDRMIWFCLAGLAGTLILEILIMNNVLWMILQHLPQGAFSTLRIAQEAVKMATSFVLSYAIASGRMTSLAKTLCVTCWALLFIIAFASLLLSSAAGMTIAICGGLFLGRGRIPWVYMISTMLIVSFFNYSKHEMRSQYWGKNLGQVELRNYPAFFMQWASLTISKMKEDQPLQKRRTTQGLHERVATFQMLLYVQRMVKTQNYSTVGGATYAMIPKLLIPRMFWPNKPRTHEGQVLLNTHFDRQSERDSWVTYIAWGLLAEAYGNFGSMFGPLLLGLFLGVCMTSIENWSGSYPLLSLRGAVGAAVLLQTLRSFEMVSAVYVTSTVQLLMIVCCAMMILAGNHRFKRAPGLA